MVIYTTKENMGKAMGYAYSDAGMKIRSASGALYYDVYYPLGDTRTYEETDIAIETEATEADKDAALTTLGVDMTEE